MISQPRLKTRLGTQINLQLPAGSGRAEVRLARGLAELGLEALLEVLGPLDPGLELLEGAAERRIDLVEERLVAVHLGGVDQVAVLVEEVVEGDGLQLAVLDERLLLEETLELDLVGDGRLELGLVDVGQADALLEQAALLDGVARGLEAALEQLHRRLGQDARVGQVPEEARLGGVLELVQAHQGGVHGASRRGLMVGCRSVLSRFPRIADHYSKLIILCQVCYHGSMKTLPVSHYIQARKKVAKSLPEDAILILAGNGEIERTKDVPYPFRQSNNFLYLTGISQPDAYLVITPDSEQLYIKQLHPFMAVWEGRTNQIAELEKISGIDQIKEYKKLDDLLSEIIQDRKGIVCLDLPDSHEAQSAAWNLWRTIQESYPKLEIAAINPQIDLQRTVKNTNEIALIQEAIDETLKALDHVKPLLKPGVTELEIAAEFVRFASVKGLEQAWPPIVSFGKNSCVIHHTPDQTALKAGDLVLFDVGLEVGGYASDISRTLQMGEGSERQDQVRQAVADVQTQSIKLMKPGIKFDEFERQSAQIMAAKLVELGLFASIEDANEPVGDLGWPAYRRYFNHYTSHYLGLDAHDVGDREAEFVPGMVLTCEPGIYIAEEGIGVRIEDDILITTEGNEILSAAPDHQ